MTKRFLHIALAILLLSACGRHHVYSPSLLRADSLCSERPDSALALLLQLSSQMPTAPEPDRMFHKLLCIKAADKANRPIIQCDSTIVRLIDYYEDGGDPAKLAETYYYAGRIYFEKQDAPQALRYFQETEDILEKSDNLELKSRLYSQEGYIFYYQELFNEMKTAYEKAYGFAKMSNDTASMIYTLRDIAVASEAFNKHKEAMQSLLQAKKLAFEINDSNLMANIDYYIACQYYYIGKDGQALNIVRKLMQNMRTVEKSAIYSLMARLLRNNNHTDSALHYFKLTEEYGTIYAKDSAFRNMSAIYLEKGDISKAKEYLHKYLEFDDSVKASKKIEMTQKIRAIYNDQKRERENLQLKEANTRKNITILVIITATCMLITTLFAIIGKNKRRHEILISRYQHLQRIKEDSFRESQQYIDENKKQIEELEQKLSLTNRENATQVKALEREIQRLQSVNKMVQFKVQDNAMAEQIIKDSAICMKFYEMPNDKYLLHPSPEDWDCLEKQINDEYPQFSKKLKSLCVLSDIEYHMCLLIKINMKPIDMAKLLNLSKSSIAMKRTRLYQKHFGEEGGSKEWDELIHSL